MTVAALSAARRGWRALALFGLFTAGAPAPLSADEIALRFKGVIDLTVFGGPVASAYSGVVMWDPATEPSGSGPEWARYLLDGAPGSVAAELVIDGIDYSDRIEPFSRFEQSFEDIFLELYFAPPIDLDAGAFPDIGLFALDMWTESPPAFDDVTHLPPDLSFLSDLERRRVGFRGGPEFEVGVSSDDVIVPEPTSLALLAAAVLGSALRKASRRRDSSVSTTKGRV